jgi:hypothetical protein
MQTISAVEIAKSAGIDPKRYRGALRKARLPWHHHYERWTVPEGGAEHKDMFRVLKHLTGRD